MDAVRYLYADDWLAPRPLLTPDTSPGALVGQCTTVDTAPLLQRVSLDSTVNVSPWAHPAITVNLGIDHEWTVPGAYLLGYGAPPTYTHSTDASSLLLPVPTFTQGNTLGTLALVPEAPNVWQPLFGLFAYTEQAADAITFVTDAQQITVRLLGYTAAGQGLESGMLQGAGTLDPTAPLQSAHVRNGAIVTIAVDGQVLELVNTWHRNPVATIYLLDGNFHTITLIDSGQHDPAFHPISRPAPLVTNPAGGPTRHNSVLLELQLGALPVGTFTRARWRAVAETADGGPNRESTWSLYVTPLGGSEALAPGQSGPGTLLAGVHYDSLVPGCNIYLGQGQRLWPPDSVTFTTDVLQMGIQSLTLGWGDSLGPCSYTSAPVYVEADDVEVFLAEWFENEAWGTFSLETGHIREDCTVIWEPAYVTTCRDQPLDLDTDLPGTNVGHAGLMAAPRGQYVRWTIRAPGVAAQLPYARDLALYYWTVERDKTMVRKLPLGEEIVLGPVLSAIVGTQETFLCDSYFDAHRLVAGSSILGATDVYLALYGQDLGLPQYLGEPPQSYRRRLAAAFSSGHDGGSLPFIASRLAELIFGQAQDPVLSGTIDPTSDPETTDQVMAVCAEANPVGPFPRQVQVWRDTSMPPQSYWIAMPPLSTTLPYQGLPAVPPAQVKTIVENYLMDILNPVASVIDLYRTSWQLVWPFRTRGTGGLAQ